MLLHCSIIIGMQYIRGYGLGFENNAAILAEGTKRLSELRGETSDLWIPWKFKNASPSSSLCFLVVRRVGDRSFARHS